MSANSTFVRLFRGWRKGKSKCVSDACNAGLLSAPPPIMLPILERVTDGHHIHHGINFQLTQVAAIHVDVGIDIHFPDSGVE